MTRLPVTKNAPQYDFILLDGSGSMQDKWWEMLDAIDSYLGTLKAQSINTHLNMTVFDSYDLELTVRDINSAECPSMRDDPPGANWGTTPLYDAIVAMGLRLRELKPIKCAITIVTDGQENGSKTTEVQARAVLDWCRAHGWAVTFIGCDFNNSRQARALGANSDNSIGVSKARLSDATAALARKRARYAHSGDDISFSDSEKQQFGGYLNAPERGQ